MPCQNCQNLKTRRLTYPELVTQWNTLYYPSEITPGYRTKLLKEANRLRTPFETTFLRFVYCNQGLLNRFYIVRGNGLVNSKPNISDCQGYR
jgi:hypothetical protein